MEPHSPQAADHTAQFALSFNHCWQKCTDRDFGVWVICKQLQFSRVAVTDSGSLVRGAKLLLPQTLPGRPLNSDQAWSLSVKFSEKSTWQCGGWGSTGRQARPPCPPQLCRGGGQSPGQQCRARRKPRPSVHRTRPRVTARGHWANVQCWDSTGLLSSCFCRVVGTRHYSPVMPVVARDRPPASRTGRHTWTGPTGPGMPEGPTPLLGMRAGCSWGWPPAGCMQTHRQGSAASPRTRVSPQCWGGHQRACGLGRPSPGTEEAGTGSSQQNNSRWFANSCSTAHQLPHRAWAPAPVPRDQEHPGRRRQPLTAGGLSTSLSVTWQACASCHVGAGVGSLDPNTP